MPTRFIARIENTVFFDRGLPTDITGTVNILKPPLPFEVAQAVLRIIIAERDDVLKGIDGMRNLEHNTDRNPPCS